MKKEKEKKEQTKDLEEKLEKDEGFSKDDYLRLAAEYDNYRKRTSKEKSEAFIIAKCDLISKFLPFWTISRELWKTKKR